MRAILVALVILVSSRILFAQEGTGRLAGSMVNLKGVAITSGTAILRLGEDSSRRFTAETDKEGVYRFASLPVGLYELELFAPTYEYRRVNKIPITAGETFRLPRLQFPLAGACGSQSGPLANLLQVIPDSGSRGGLNITVGYGRKTEGFRVSLDRNAPPQLTNARGVAVFRELPPGTYRVSIRHKGFDEINAQGYEVYPGLSSDYEISLTPLRRGFFPKKSRIVVCQ